MNKFIPNQYKEILLKLFHLRQQIVHLNRKLKNKNYSKKILNLVKTVNKTVNYLHKTEQLNSKKDILSKIDILKEKRARSQNSKRIFDEKIKNVEMLLNQVGMIKKSNINYRFKVIIYQQLIVMTVSAFEIYGRKRFLELEKSFREKGKIIDYDSIFKRFFSQKERISQKKRIIKKSEESRKSIFQILIEERIVNFQNWNHFKRAYNKAFGIVMGKIYEETHIFEEMQNFFEWRNIVIHSKIDSPVLNFATSPPDDPIYLNKEILEKRISDFKDVINIIHNFSKNLLEN